MNPRVTTELACRRNCCCLFLSASKSAKIVEFLYELWQQIRQPRLMISDGLPARRSAVVREYLEMLNGATRIEQLPAYATEFNPTEYIWAHRKHHKFANCYATRAGGISSAARATDCASCTATMTSTACAALSYLRTDAEHLPP